VICYIGKVTEDYDKIVNSHKRMAMLIRMTKMPHFRGYFDLFQLITFGIHLVTGVHQNGKVFDACSRIPPSAMPVFPPLFSPLPVRKVLKVDPNITLGTFLMELNKDGNLIRMASALPKASMTSMGGIL
jgi:hypothetical protein